MKSFSENPKYPSLCYYKIVPEAIDPAWGTDESACFDLSACLVAGNSVKIYGPNNKTRLELITTAKPTITIDPYERAMIPTGLIFELPHGYDLKIYCRSGCALKQGLVLVNKVGVIDPDYVQETFLTMQNESMVPIEISHGQRIAQAQMKEDFQYNLVCISRPPTQKTNRDGGFGSTGTNKLS